jgi:hypothetical protein
MWEDTSRRTRRGWWIGAKVFRKNPPDISRWWAGHALRDFDAVNNVWLNTYTMGQDSMIRDLDVNADLNVSVAGLRFNVPVARLLHPVAPPAGYPNQLFLDTK